MSLAAQDAREDLANALSFLPWIDGKSEDDRRAIARAVELLRAALNKLEMPPQPEEDW